MKLRKSLEEIWKIKEKMSEETAGMTPSEVVKYFEDRIPERAKKLPTLPIPSKGRGQKAVST